MTLNTLLLLLYCSSSTSSLFDNNDENSIIIKKIKSFEFDNKVDFAILDFSVYYCI
jgi:hypothetical protein